MKFHCIVIFLLLILHKRVTARDSTTLNFIKHFIANEGKPINLIFNDLCWSLNHKVKLVKDLSEAGYRSSNSLNVFSKYMFHHYLFLADLNCPNAAEVLVNATSRNLFKSPFRWLVLMDSSNVKQDGLSTLFEAPLLPDSELVLAERIGETFKIIELHRPSPDHFMISTPRGHFNGTLHDTRARRELFPRRNNLLKHTLTMSNVVQDSNTTLYHLPREDRSEPQNDAVAKICWMNVMLLFQMLNVTPRYIFNYRWGYIRNGTWSGMVDDVATGKADLGTNCLMLLGRQEVVTFTDLIAPLEVRFVFRQPPLPYTTNIFSLPFSTGVWVAIVVCAAVTTFSLYATSFWELKQGYTPTQLDGSMGDALLLTMSAVGQQGCYIEPRKLSGRIITWVFFSALMLLYAAYSANIVVLLQAPSNSIRTLAQLAASKITLAAIDVDYNHFVFKQYSDPVRVTIMKKIYPEKGKSQFYEFNEGVERIRQGLFAFHGIVEQVYRRIEETFLETEKCDLTEVDFLNGFNPLVPVTKGSPYLELIKVGFKRIREAGLQHALKHRMQVRKPRCLNKAAAFYSVGYGETQPVLVFMLMGTALSVAIAMMEVVVFKMYPGVVVYVSGRCVPLIWLSEAMAGTYIILVMQVLPVRN